MFLDSLHLARDEFIALAQDLTALRMTADDIAAAEACLLYTSDGADD